MEEVAAETEAERRSDRRMRRWRDIVTESGKTLAEKLGRF